MKIKDTEIPVSFLAECFDANFDTGVLIWRERPEAHFGGRRRACAVFNGKHANKRADKPHSKGYRQVPDYAPKWRADRYLRPSRPVGAQARSLARRSDRP